MDGGLGSEGWAAGGLVGGGARTFRGTQNDDDLPNWYLGDCCFLCSVRCRNLYLTWGVAGVRGRSCDAMRHGHGHGLALRMRMRCTAMLCYAMRCDAMPPWWTNSIE